MYLIDSISTKVVHFHCSMRFCWLPSNLTMMRRLQEVHSPTHNTKEAANLLGLLNKPKTVCDILSMDFRKDSVFLSFKLVECPQTLYILLLKQVQSLSLCISHHHQQPIKSVVDGCLETVLHKLYAYLYLCNQTVAQYVFKRSSVQVKKRTLHHQIVCFCCKSNPAGRLPAP